MSVSSTAKNYRLGFDLGSVALKLVVTDAGGVVVDSFCRRTYGRPLYTAWQGLQEVARRWEGAGWDVVGGTGAGGRRVCGVLGTPYWNEVICQAAAVRTLRPDARTVLEIGGQDSKIIFLGGGNGEGRLIVDFAMNSQCAGGTGSFLDQQAARLGIRIEEEFGQLALESTSPPAVAGRCSVFAKSDMIHLQQRATPMPDILAGLCLGLARNLRCNLARGQPPARPIVFCGGVAANAGVVRALEEVFELHRGELVVPELHVFTGALGAILIGMEQRRGGVRRDGDRIRLRLELLEESLREGGQRGGSLLPLTIGGQGRSNDKPAAALVSPEQAGGTAREGYLGLDVGSISTKIAVIDRAGVVLAKTYLMTAGRPLEAVRRALREIGQQLGGMVRIQGAATTGSGRYLTGDFIGADLVVNEITAQATAAAAIDPAVDTIFEIGGQDSKYIRLEDGVVVDFEMNHSCAAGTGSFLEEQAQRLGIQIDEEFAKLALTSREPAALGDRCTVFMESELVGRQQEGAAIPDLVAGLCYSVAQNYLQRVVGSRPVGRRIFFQGGTAFNRGVGAALERLVGKTVAVPPHHEITGAIGAALLAHRRAEENRRAASRFGGFGLADVTYELRRFTCHQCENACEINQVRMPDRSPLHYGSRCDRWNVRRQEAGDVALPDLFAQRQQLLSAHAKLADAATAGAGAMGLPMALSNYELLPLWSHFLDALGFRVVAPAGTTRPIIERGREAALANCCFPVKLAHGHAFALVEQGVESLWIPAVASLPPDEADPQINQSCPYVASLPYQLRCALAHAGRQVEVHGPLVRLAEGPRALTVSLEPFGRRLGVSSRQLRRAVDQGWEAQSSFQAACRKRGREVLSNLPRARRHVILVGRPYSACDPGAYLHLADKLRNLNVLAIPLDFLDLRRAVPDDPLYRGMYWKSGQRFLRAAEVIREHPQLAAIYLSHFSCGPDSFVIDYFRRRMKPKPTLVLEIDEHSADAGLATRLEAFLESLENRPVAGASGRAAASASAEGRPINGGPRQAAANDRARTIYIPWMGDQSHGMAAAFQAFGHDARVIPRADAESLRLGRQHASGKQCLPCIMTAGDMVRVTQLADFDPKRSAFLMPGGCGPCRFGQYSRLHQVILEELGLGQVPVLAPAHDQRLYEDWKRFPGAIIRHAWYALAAYDVLLKACLAVRPYEREPGQTDRVYRRWCRGVDRLIRARASPSRMAAFMDRAAHGFSAIPLNPEPQRPRIGIVGEIYVRHHDVANSDLVRRLESLGAQTHVASFPEWFYYTNWVRMNDARRMGRWGYWFLNVQKNLVQRRRHARLAAPFEKRFGPIVEPPTEKLLALAEPFLDPQLKGGDAVLSIAKMVELRHGGFHGAINVMPFGCMPSTVVDAVMKTLAGRLAPMPLLSVCYDGQDDPGLATRLEAFVHQARDFQTAVPAASATACEVEASTEGSLPVQGSV